MPATSVQALAAALRESPIANANNVPLLLDELPAISGDEALLRGALDALQCFFTAAYDEGALSHKRRKVRMPDRRRQPLVVGARASQAPQARPPC